jgi:hypothetical protein
MELFSRWVEHGCETSKLKRKKLLGGPGSLSVHLDQQQTIRWDMVDQETYTT